MKVEGGKQAVKRLEVWASPGKEQTLDDLITKYGDQVIAVDRDGDRVLIGLMGEWTDA